MVSPVLHLRRLRLKKGNCWLEVTQLIIRNRTQTQVQGPFMPTGCPSARLFTSLSLSFISGSNTTVSLPQNILGTCSRLAEVGVGEISVPHQIGTPALPSQTYTLHKVTPSVTATPSPQKKSKEEHVKVITGRGSYLF